MRLASPWSPRLADPPGLLFERLARALAEDIAEGRVPPGARLPAHRDLAYALGLGLGTVTKAYAQLERLGLARSVHGQGTFATGVAARPAGLVDLSVNAPPQGLSDSVLAATLAALARRLDAGAFAAYGPPAGRPEHRAAAARWLAGHRLQVEAERLMLCNGAQHALSVALATACRPGEAILTEHVTYPGFLALCRHAGYRPRGLAMDAEGLAPAALEAALRGGGARLLYVTPSLQNPTGATMGLGRRREIVSIARAHGLLIVEDDVYSVLGPGGLPTLAELAPERVFYVNGLSKSLSPGLRIGLLASPAEWAARAAAALQASCTGAAPLACLMMEQWLADGTAAAVADTIRREAARRSALARRLLPTWLPAEGPEAFHVWAPMPAAEAARLAQRAAAVGVLVTPPAAVAVDPDQPEGGLRLCLGAPDAARLEAALRSLAALAGEGAAVAV
ncbi:MAG TPA: PLP-dependent aminotransferase family protein [Alphaproteobacteria bacterium]|nr:PLP-dependent aminotransferase family protein [Alphaproteobacteria bacterium]